MSFLVFFIGIAVALEAHSTAPGIYVGVALIITGAVLHTIEERGG